MAPKMTPAFEQWLNAVWRDGFTKGVDGRDEIPTFSDLYPEVKDSADSPEHLSSLPFNAEKCEARILKDGYGVQCTRSPFESGCLCKMHQKKFDGLADGLDLAFGRFNKDRPLLSLDREEGNKIAWQDLKKDKKGKSPTMKVGDLRDYLSTRIPNENFKGLKKPELQELYDKEKASELENSGSQDAPVDPVDPVESVDEPAQESAQESAEESAEEPAEESAEEPAQESAEEPAEESAEEPAQESTEEPAQEPTQESTEESAPRLSEHSEEEIGEMLDDGAGTGFNIEPKYPKTIHEYKELFKKLSIDSENLKNSKRSYRVKYDEYLKEKEEESDDETEDLSKDNTDFEEFLFEAVDYLEDTDSAKIYNTKHIHVGSWNEDCDDIIWVADEFREQHETNRP
jgi:hypothetical protein